MPEDLDPTTARLASELASRILPSLSKSLNSAVVSPDISVIIERTNKSSQEIKSSIEKLLRSEIDDNRAGRSVILQTISSLLEEISSLKRSIEKIPSNINLESKSTSSSTQSNNNSQELSQKLDNISSQLDELIHGIKSFFEAYAHDKEQLESHQTPTQIQHIYSGSDADLDKIINTSFPSLENLLRANAKSQSNELEDLSQEISAQNEQNNLALTHEIKNEISNKINKLSEELIVKLNEEQKNQIKSIKKMFNLLLITSGASIITIITMIIALLLK